ncbi:hypothetical protein D3C78_1697200 [compost metagenome]
MRHASPLNAQFVAGFRQQAPATSNRPTIMAVSAYDGMAALYAALKKTGGKADGATLMEAFKDLTWESPRGPVRLDAQTRDIVQTNYIRRYEKVGAEFGNTEISKVGP